MTQNIKSDFSYRLKVLLMGITGDVAARKVLPGLSAFASHYKNEVRTSLVGWSRSQADKDKIEDVILEYSTDRNNPFASVEYIQSDYGDPKAFFDIVSSLEENEKLIVYLALPPKAFLEILKTACPYSSSPIYIVIEKPYGESQKDLEDLAELIRICNLRMQAQFFDHYLFKPQVLGLDDYSDKIKEFIGNSKLVQAEAKAVETVGLEGRAGYYDGTGAVRDMSPHLYSVTEYFCNVFLGMNLDWSRAVVIDQVRGQYRDYEKDLGKPSQTETYFKSTMNLEDLTIVLESGKARESKVTELRLLFDDSKELILNIYPDSCLTFGQGNSQERVEIKAKYPYPDHFNLFAELCMSMPKHFVASENALEQWHVINKITDYKNKEKRLIVY
jgi:glucose-6-phosphate 1-dehydrogenase